MYAFGKLSLVASVIILLTFIAEKFGILNIGQVIIIAIIAVTIQAISLGILLVIVVTKYKKTHEIRIVRYQVSNRLINGGTYIIPEHMSSTDPRKSALFEVFLEIENFNEPPKILINKESDGRIKQYMKDNIASFKSGIVNDNFIFTAGIMVRPEEKINFLIEKDATVKYFMLGEIYVP